MIVILDKTQNNKGFTLIELLVVVAIISILTAVALTSFQDARTKAANSKKIQEVDQLVTALALYYEDNGGYPYFGDVSDLNNPEMYCVGYVNGEECFGAYPLIYSGFVGSSNLNNSLDEYISGPPKNDYSIQSGSYDYKGIAYGCSEGALTCSEYELWWYLKDTDSCPKGTEQGTGNVRCRLSSENVYEE
jgi:prepilin-type N-terminal cleavage/methylation domain-containing protein